MTPTSTSGPSSAVRQYQGYEIGMLIDLGWNQFEWLPGTGNWSEGASSLTGTRWINRNISLSNPNPPPDPDKHRRILAPLGSITHNIVLKFGGSGSTGYTATNDLPANPFQLNRLILASTATATNIIAGNALRMSNDNGFNVLPRIDQQGTGAFRIDNAIAIPIGLEVVQTTTGAVGGDVTLTGTISGAGGITKSGPFALYLTGAGNNYTGTTTVNGGTLGGNAPIGNGLNVGAAGTLAPGTPAAPIGTLTVNGNVSFAPGADFDVDMIQTGPADRLRVLGAGRSVTLTNADLVADFLPGTGSTDRWFLIELVDGSSTITGRFAGLPNDGSSLVVDGTTLFISYTGDTTTSALTGGNDVVLSTVPVPEPGWVLAVAGLGLVGYVRRRRAA
jgi:MYXO-CTERM domain-containing protein